VLRHFHVGSPEVLMIYRGTIKLNRRGDATVTLPEYFAALTDENGATVTLTAIGRPFMLGYEWRPDHRSFIAFGKPEREISWVVYAERDDSTLHGRSTAASEDKGTGKICERGEFLNPEAHGQPETKGISHRMQIPAEILDEIGEQRKPLHR